MGAAGKAAKPTMVDTHAESDTLRILKLGPLGPWSNNAFVLIDRATNQSAIIDAVPEIDQVLAATQGTTLRMVLFTHSHPDHIASFDELRTAVDVPFYMHPDEPWADHQPTRIEDLAPFRRAEIVSESRNPSVFDQNVREGIENFPLPAEEKLEDSSPLAHSRPEVSLRHGELVEIGQKGREFVPGHEVNVI